MKNILFCCQNIVWINYDGWTDERSSRYWVIL